MEARGEGESGIGEQLCHSIPPSGEVVARPRRPPRMTLWTLCQVCDGRTAGGPPWRSTARMVAQASPLPPSIRPPCWPSTASPS
jgi:hypothetical protein